MPRYFCDYCDVYLTHDSAPGRKQHIRGWKHRENVKQYYEQHMTVWKSNFGRPTPSTRYFLRSCVCSMTWRFHAIDATLSP